LVTEYELESKEQLLQYDRHQGAVNSIVFLPDGDRFVTTSDDKGFRVWETSVPVTQKWHTDASMNSMPSCAIHPAGKYVACQSLDNSIQIFEAFGKLAKVTIVRDKVTRESKGVAFVLFVIPEDAQRASKELNDTALNGRTIKCSIAVDNGRAREFIKKKIYTEKSRCYECGEEGHLSYKCPKNLLGDRQKPQAKQSKKRRKKEKDANEDKTQESGGEEEEGPENAEDYDDFYEQKLVTFDNQPRSKARQSSPKKRKSGYFSDEDASD